MTCERSNASATTTAADGFNLSPAFGTAFPRIVPRFGENFLAVPDARTPMVEAMQIHILGDTPRPREGLPKSRDQASVLLARDLVTRRKASVQTGTPTERDIPSHLVLPDIWGRPRYGKRCPVDWHNRSAQVPTARKEGN